MERIKQALDKARAERGDSRPDIAPERAQIKDARSPEPQSFISEVNIQYSVTKISEPDAAALRQNRIIFDETDKFGLTAYKMLRTQILQRMSAKGWNALAVTSPSPGDGKTITSINLAVSLAREIHKTVLLVDMDLRNPSIHRYFGLHINRGIGDYLLKGVPMSEVLVHPQIDKLVLLPGKESIENSSEILGSPAMGDLVQELKSRYPSRIVIFDMPPILSSDDALSFSPYIDAFLLVIRNGKTTQAELEHSMEMLRNTPIIGTVLNCAEEKITPYY